VTGWIKFVNNKVADRRMGRAARFSNSQCRAASLGSMLITSRKPYAWNLSRATNALACASR